MVVFDLEADGLLDEVTTVHCGVFKCVKTGRVKKFYPHQIQSMLKFMDKQPVLIGHNVISYDFAVLRKLYNYEYKGKKVDTLIMSRLLYPQLQVPKKMAIEYQARREEEMKRRRAGEDIQLTHTPGPHSIAAWGYRVGRGKVEYHDWAEFDEAMMHRCSEDVEIQTLVYQKLRTKMAEVKWPRESMETTFRMFEILQLQEEYGWKLDIDRTKKFISILTHWINRIDRLVKPAIPPVMEVCEVKKDGLTNWVRKPFLKSGKYSAITIRWFPDLEGKTAKTGYVSGPFTRIKFRTIDLDSRNECVQYLLDAGWIPQEWNYQKDSSGRPLKDDNGQFIQTSPKLTYKDEFEGVSGFAGKLIAKRIQCRHRRSTLEGFLRDVRPDGRLSQRITGIAATGRLTHSGIVNIPGAGSFFGKKMRQVFTSKEGYVIVGTDAASCQDRCLASRANDEGFTRMLLDGRKEDGTDGHSLNMKAINAVLDKYGISITRDEAKNHGYGWKFGASDKKLGSMVQKGPEVGAEIRDALASVSTAQAALVESLTSEWTSRADVRLGWFGRPEHYNGYITGLDGRPVLIELPHTVLVYTLQSDEAIIMQLALVILYDELTKLGWRHGVEYGFVANIHDEYQAEVRKDLAKQYAQLAEWSIQEASRRLGCPVLQKGEADIGDNWADTH